MSIYMDTEALKRFADRLRQAERAIRDFQRAYLNLRDRPRPPSESQEVMRIAGLPQPRRALRTLGTRPRPH